jgi:hypothetical protein
MATECGSHNCHFCAYILICPLREVNGIDAYREYCIHPSTRFISETADHIYVKFRGEYLVVSH